MELWELAAREAIRETVARYAHLVDRGRIDELVELFTQDGTLEAGDRPPARGRAGVRAAPDPSPRIQPRHRGDRLRQRERRGVLPRHHRTRARSLGALPGSLHTRRRALALRAPAGTGRRERPGLRLRRSV